MSRRMELFITDCYPYTAARQLCHKASSKHVGPFLSISRENCEVECIPDKCCLEQGEEEDCDTLQMLGGCFLNVPPGESRTVRLAAPLLDPFERRGYCVVHLHSKLRSHVFRDRITIPFDTSSESNATPCPQVDQDPFNDCHPVNCDTHYNGQKPHYSRRLKRCLTIPPCPEDVMYNADTNKCVEPIRTRDIRLIKSIVRKKRRRKGSTNAMRSHNKKSNITNITDSVQETTPKKMKCFAWNSVGALTFIIFAQCCLVVTLIIWIRKRCKRAKKNKDVVNKFVNRIDSMTTPLLSTNCTLTTCQYKSESSSHIDSKIKSYKAFHKDQTKCTMSDDILTRCLKRRDWTRPKSSDVVPEIKEAEYIDDTMNKIVEKWTKNREFSECNIEKSVPELPEDVPVERQSEREVKCFDYEEKVQNVNTNIVTVSAQASFSRDSIDDFLSEHGLDYLIGESRYTFSNTSSGASSKKAHFISMHKLGPASDPGGGVSDDLELLHMSRASMFSSSNASLHRTMRRTKDSRSSM